MNTCLPSTCNDVADKDDRQRRGFTREAGRRERERDVRPRDAAAVKSLSGDGGLFSTWRGTKKHHVPNNILSVKS